MSEIPMFLGTHAFSAELLREEWFENVRAEISVVRKKGLWI